MDTQAQHLLAEALKLPADTREDLAIRLMGSVEPTDAESAEIHAAWVEEIDRRVARLESGESQATPIEDAWPRITGRAWREKPASDG